jgi:hypothetical protein
VWSFGATRVNIRQNAQQGVAEECTLSREYPLVFAFYERLVWVL